MCIRDSTKTTQVGMNARDVAQSVLVSLSGSFQTAPNFWLNPKNGVTYQVAVQSPQYRMTSLQDLMNMPVNDPGVPSSQVLGNLVQLTPATRPLVVSHYNVQPVIDVYASTQDRDLGAVAKDTMKVLQPFQQHLPRGTQIIVRGQVVTMQSSFIGLGIGLLMAISLVYFLIVVNFQSWLDPFIIITALPGALAGICWILLLTHTTLSVPSLTGAVMCMGVATANSILLVSFARERMNIGIPAAQAALEAGYTRIRPVLMTALAMIIGMVPMSLGLGEGGEQNAPLGRAVIGGLLFATVATLFLSLIHISACKGVSRPRRRPTELTSCSRQSRWITRSESLSAPRFAPKLNWLCLVVIACLVLYCIVCCVMYVIGRSGRKGML